MLGGLTYPDGKGAAYENTSHLVSPRIGIAWSPEKLHGKTVIRTGFGLFAAPILINYLAQNGNYSSNPIIDQEGFSQQTVMTPSTNNYLSPVGHLQRSVPGRRDPASRTRRRWADHVSGQQRSRS